MIVAAGDIASARSGDARTARLVRRLDPDRVLTLGDNAYPSGTAAQFAAYYDPTWGTFRSITSPSPGTHDFRPAGATGYRRYFGSRAPAWNYHFVLGRWLVVSLNSATNRSAAERALRRVLSADRHRCELVYWHEPRWSSGTHGNDGAIAGLWNVAARHGVDVVLNGHDHHYERFARLSAVGRPSSAGAREFVVGSGGVGVSGFEAPRPGSQRRIAALGVLRMSLRRESYSWSFHDVANETRDHGATACHR